MALRIAQLGQPILRSVAREVPADEIASPAFQQFLAEMAATMQQAGGVGLAAPQVFDGRRVFLARVLPAKSVDELPGIETFINPRIVAVSEERVAGWEGCLSFQELTVLVPRHSRVVVEYHDASGSPKSLDLVGFPARVVQHENDHLDGILTIDRATSSREIVKTSEMDDVIAHRRQQSANGSLPTELEDDDDFDDDSQDE